MPNNYIAVDHVTSGAKFSDLLLCSILFLVFVFNLTPGHAT